MSEETRNVLATLARGIPFELIDENPSPIVAYQQDCSIPHAPTRVHNLTEAEKKVAIKNALRYFPEKYHKVLAVEFHDELERFGHVYMYRLLPKYEMKAYPIDLYPAKLVQARAIQLMIMNNLDKQVAQFPHELVTYGGNGCVFQNWAQYHLMMKYLSEMTDEQTLVMYSGHPMGLFPSFKLSPRVVVTNGMIVPHFSGRDQFEKMFAMGTTMYGQMTAGSYCYIGPQGIVHGTTLTILNAGRKYLGTSDLAGKVFVTSGLGGMSGAQPKAAKISGCLSVTAEVDLKAAEKRKSQGWVDIIVSSLEEVVSLIKTYKKEKKVVSIAYHGNIVDLWERLALEDENIIDLGSDQTSCHNVFGGGYYPTGYTVDEANELMKNDPESFKGAVQGSLRRHIKAINTLAQKGMRFWDYGNSFLFEASRAGADVMLDENRFKYPSYVEDIMGDIFSLGFGPFRWVCTSGKEEDLECTDKTASDICHRLSTEADELSGQQYDDNYRWISTVGDHKLVVGSQARILYSDHIGRAEIALAFNKLVKEGVLTAPVVISRDHHDVSGTDSPYRETSNITDGSNWTADMAVQNFIGDGIRGATWCALHNGGGTGWGMAMNGGFGLVLDGSNDVEERIKQMLYWDVLNGISRRAWSGNSYANEIIKKVMNERKDTVVTLRNEADDDLINSLFK